MPAVSIFPRGLKPDALYREETSGRVYPAGALMSAGLPLPLGMGEYESACFHLLAVSG
jgi:alpha-galactosidase